LLADNLLYSVSDSGTLNFPAAATSVREVLLHLGGGAELDAVDVGVLLGVGVALGVADPLALVFGVVLGDAAART